MSLDFEYRAELTLDSGASVFQDLEEPDWKAKGDLARTRRLTIVPLDQTSALPLVSVLVPEGGEAVWNTRVYGSDVDGPLFRVYALGWTKDSLRSLTVVHPGGHIEQVSDINEALLPQLILETMTRGA